MLFNTYSMLLASKLEIGGTCCLLKIWGKLEP